MRAFILAVGDELLEGAGLDTNSQWLSQQLQPLGIAVSGHLAAGDGIDAIRRALQFAAANADLVLVTGGLGPTFDDLTRQAIADFAGAPLERNSRAMEMIADWRSRRGYPMTEANAVQAMIPRGATMLENHWGTAPGFHVRAGAAWIAAFPGVPHEMRSMFTTEFQPLLAPQSGSTTVIAFAHLFGLPESDAHTLLVQEFDPAQANPSLGIYVQYGIVRIKLKATAPTAEAAQTLIDRDMDRLRRIFGRHLFSTTGESQAEAISRLLQARPRLIATAESCTGGRVAAELTGIPGISRYYMKGVITYSNAAKTELLGVPEAVLREHGAVSPACALAMAEGWLHCSGADATVAVTGIAGPGGGTPLKPVGLVYIAGAIGADPAVVEEHRFLGERAVIQARATQAALDLLRRLLEKE